MSSSGTHMVAPEAYKPYVGGNSNRCGTTLTDVGLAITTTRSSPWLVLPTLGDEPINREELAPQSG